jgi:AcrR family transcriptional regulator
MSPRPSVEAQRRDEALTATCEIIAEVGFRGVRIADVARRVGMATGTIHYYFGTKQELLDAAFQHAVARSRRRSLASIEGIADPWERLTMLLRSALPTPDQPFEWSLWMHLWAEAVVRPELRALNQQSYESWADLVEGIITEGQEQGVFAPVPARALTLQLLTMMDGLAIQQTVQLRELDGARVNQLLLSFARSALGRLGDGT